MPEALDLTSTLVMGWTLPVATTERAMSPRSTFAELGGFEFGAVSAGCGDHAEDDGHDEDGEAGPEPDLAFTFALRGQNFAPSSCGKVTLPRVRLRRTCSEVP